MQIPGFIRNIPAQLHQAWGNIANTGRATKDWIIQRITTQSALFIQSDFWKKHGKPLYERNIKPLDKQDYLLLTGSFATAGIIAVFSIQFFIALFPLVMAADGFLFFGACKLSQHRIQIKFNEEAWDHVDHIRRSVNDITHRNQDFNTITRYRGMLSQPKFSHLKDQIKELDERIREFRIVALSPYFEEQQQIIKGLFINLKQIVQEQELDKPLIEALETEVNKIGTQQENLETLELQKQNLQNLQTQLALARIPELKQQVNELLKLAKKPRFLDSKVSCMNYLEELQRNLAAHKQIDILIPRGPLEEIPLPPNNQDPQIVINELN